MLSLVYVSNAARHFTEEELAALLNKSREKNARLDITGMLLYKDGAFMQVLEGPEDAVRELFRTIEADDRHKSVVTLLEWTIQKRQFADWKMAFRNLHDPAIRELRGYSEFMNRPLDSESYRTDPSQVRRLLEVFRRDLWKETGN